MAIDEEELNDEEEEFIEPVVTKRRCSYNPGIPFSDHYQQSETMDCDENEVCLKFIVRQ